MRDAVETYVSAMANVRSTGAGTAETSYYPPLIGLLNTIGKQLKPAVMAISHVRNTGSGIPDVGVFTTEQRADLDLQRPMIDVRPSRGVMEIKPLGDNVAAVAASKQVQGYVQHYGQVLVTNYRAFLLVEHAADGDIRTSESISLAETEAEFWEQARDPAAFAERWGELLKEFLHRVLVRQVSLTQPQDVALLLASYARDMSARLELQRLDDLAPIRESLEAALGISFEGARGAHFFRSTVVQTLFYGVFSAWVLQKRDVGRGSADAPFDWRLAGWHLKVPAIQSLFHTFSEPGNLTHLGLGEVLEWTGEMLNRIDAEQFFERFSEDQAVQYFYEPFLAEFDPELRKQLGVWYTPREIVTYMVERVDTVLREELGIARGLADESVYVLDPCTGTGSYLVEVLRRIHRTLEEEGADALAPHDLKEAAKNRLFGFELLPAPFVVAHLQMGLALQQLGAPLGQGVNDRPAIFLTNALTGWDQISDDRYTQLRDHALLNLLAGEGSKAGAIKREGPILVIIGNPPYNGFAGVAVNEERDLTDAYREARATRDPQGKGLNDLCVRFFRMAERKIVEQTGRGVVCYISNYSWLDGLSFPAMRERYLNVFDRIWIDNLHGDRRISEYAPDGRTSETVFAMPRNNSSGIKVGTAIATLVASGIQSDNSSEVLYRDVDQARAEERRTALVESLTKPDLQSHYSALNPEVALGYPFKPTHVNARYLVWPKLSDLFPTMFPGVMTSRDELVMDIDRDRLIERMRAYFDPKRSDAEIARLMPRAMHITKRFDPVVTRSQLVRRGFLPNNVVRYAYRPFDVRWLYWEPETKLLDEKRADYRPHVAPDNPSLVSQQKPRRDWSGAQVVSAMGCLDLLDRGATCFPQRLQDADGGDLPNLSRGAMYFVTNASAVPNDLFHHVSATLHAPVYRMNNHDALGQDWPRIPLPTEPEALAHSAALGRHLAALLDVDQDVPGVSSGAPRPDLRGFAVLARRDGGSLDLDAGDLRLAAKWGSGGKGKPIMPGRGRAVERAVTGAESDLLGVRTVDVWLNDMVCWANVPEPVWEYTLGGYQVLKKWLSYREHAVLGRDLRADEARTFMQIARRIAAILLLGDDLNASYQRCALDVRDWLDIVDRAKPQQSLF